MARRVPAAFGLWFVAAALMASVVACTTATGPAGLPTTACDSAARFASTDPSRQARRLDPVLRACTSIEDLEAVGAKYSVALAGNDTIGRFDAIGIAVVGIGAFGTAHHAASSSLIRSGAVSAAEMDRLAELGAVGDLLVHPFTAAGVFVAPDLAVRAIAISIDQLRRVPTVVATAAGTAKVAAIRGALATGVIAVLVTDAPTARGLLG
jgi:Putative sugar-binding domain